jgi:hypothetical protein
VNLDPDSQNNLENLISEISRDQCCAFIGSGISQPAGYPSWVEVIHMLCDATRIKTGEEHFDSSKEFRYLAEECRKKLSEDEYDEVLISAFHPNGRDRYRSIHQRIREIPFHGYITTNYDLCLEKAGIALGQNIRTLYYPELDISKLRERHIYHIHGVLESDKIEATIGTLVLSERDYRFAYEQDDLVPGFLKQLLPYHTVVFMGFSLGDEDITKVLRTVQLSLQIRSDFEAKARIGIRKPLRQFIFLHQEEGIKQEELDKLDAQVKDLALLPIYYHGESKRHSELETILEFIRERTTSLPIPTISLHREMFEGNHYG